MIYKNIKLAEENVKLKKEIERRILNLIKVFERDTRLKVDGIIWYEGKPILDVGIEK